MYLFDVSTKSGDTGVGSILAPTLVAFLLPIDQLGEQSIYRRYHDDDDDGDEMKVWCWRPATV
jgi:hypothetical protein